MSESKKAVVLLSGGLDSATVAAIAKAEGFELFCLSFHYGQRQDIEVEKADKLAAFFGARKHLVLKLDMGLIGGSALTDRSIEVPKLGADLDAEELIPITYVPARNTIFLSYAASWAEVVGAQDIFIGVNALDYSGYPDCRPEYLQVMQKAINMGTRLGVENGDYFRLRAPLLQLKKSEIIRKGLALGVDYAMTISCYDPDPSGHVCGLCDSCHLRENAFREVAIKDPAL